MKRGIPFAALLAVSAGALAAGQTGTEGMAERHSQPPVYSEVDANQDGVVTRDEARSHPDLDARWDQLDMNRDDRLDRSEFARFEMREPPQASEPGAALDSDVP